MGILDNAFGIVRKVGAAVGIPAAITESAIEQGMGTNTMLGPGQAIAPVDGYSRVPRSMDYQTGVNITNRPRTNQRVSFSTLRALVDSYDIAQICITHRIDSIRSYAWSLVPADGIQDDMSEAIAFANRVLAKPDGELPFKSWLSKYLYDVLAFDAGCLYKKRNRGGKVIGLQVIDGTTIAPLLDGWGNRPQPPADAFVQYVQGQVWNWLTADDLIYIPYRPTSNSPYGKAPLESILINANTDLRFQMFFMQRFTSGTIPEGFAVAPEDWTPDQLEQWQNRWDALMYGDQEILQQIKWVPGGTSFEWKNDDEFSADFSLFLMRKTAAAYHIPPADLGFTDDVNKSSGETQATVSERVGDLPLKQHVEDILTMFLQEDLGVPLVFQFDDGGEDEDKLATAQADQIYIQNGVVSSSRVAELRFGVVDDEGQNVPRFVMGPQGPIPLSTLLAQSGEITAETNAPVPGSVVPAVQREQLAIAAPAELAKAADADNLVELQKAELTAFRRFAKARQRQGTWRDFQFNAIDAVTAHRLNVTEYGEIRKADGEVIAAGLAVLAKDTGRVLMLQRGLDPEDDASGTWEFPGGHVEPGESALDAAAREWCEETGLALPRGTYSEGWTSPDGVYAGFVLTIEAEAAVSLLARTPGTNPDDPDGDMIESIAWWDPADLVGNPAVRRELAADLSTVLKALRAPALAGAPCPCCGGAREHDTGAECYGCDSSGLAEGYTGDVPCAGTVPDVDVQKRVTLPTLPGDSPFARGFNTATAVTNPTLEPEDDAAPLVMKAWRDSSNLTPQHEYDLILTDYYAPKVQAALDTMIAHLEIAELVDDLSTDVVKDEADDIEIRDALVRRIAAGLTLSQADVDLLHQLLVDIAAEGYATGAYAASVQLGAHAVVGAGLLAQAVVTIDWSKWKPGDPAAVLHVADGALRAALDAIGITVQGITDSVLDQIGNRIAEGLEAGHGGAKIERDVRDLVGGREGKVSTRAERIVYTEVARAQTSGSFDVFRVSGVTEYDLLISDGACPTCEALAENNPYKLDDDTAYVPVHPFCRCADSPRAESIDESRIIPTDPEG